MNKKRRLKEMSENRGEITNNFFFFLYAASFFEFHLLTWMVGNLDQI
jgi:hypothetical protein